MKQALQVVVCSADFPDDTVWDEEENNLIQTGGLAMANAVADLLRANGAEVWGIEDHLEHGWEMAAAWRDGKFWLQVTAGGTDSRHSDTRLQLWPALTFNGQEIAVH